MGATTQQITSPPHLFWCASGAALSVPTATVPRVESDDVVDPGDAALQALLATDDDEKRDRLMDYILTVPPLTEWPPDCREKLGETCQFMRDLSRDLRHNTEYREDGR